MVVRGLWAACVEVVSILIVWRLLRCQSFLHSPPVCQNLCQRGGVGSKLLMPKCHNIVEVFSIKENYYCIVTDYIFHLFCSHLLAVHISWVLWRCTTVVVCPSLAEEGIIPGLIIRVWQCGYPAIGGLLRPLLTPASSFPAVEKRECNVVFLKVYSNTVYSNFHYDM